MEINQQPPLQTVQVTPPVQTSMFDFAKLKKFFIFSLIGSLIISALTAAVIVLVGTFNELANRVFATLAMVVLHSLVSLFFIWDDKKQDTFQRLSLFINVLFFLIIISFLTSIFGIWEILPGDLIHKLYQAYFVVGFAALHADILSKALGKEKYMDVTIYLNYLFMAIVFFMLQMVIFIDNRTLVLGEPFYRILGASGIVDGTLSILTIIFYKLYTHNHPQEQSALLQDGQSGKTSGKGLSTWVWILFIYLAFQVITSLLYSFRWR